MDRVWLQSNPLAPLKIDESGAQWVAPVTFMHNDSIIDLYLVSTSFGTIIRWLIKETAGKSLAHCTGQQEEFNEEQKDKIVLFLF